MPPNPMYSAHLEYAPTFRWGGREWGEGDLSAFMKKIGGPKKYNKWARRHRVAAKTFDPIEGQIYSQYQPVITGIDAERKKKAEYYTRLMNNLAGFTTALGPMLGAHSGAIGSAYGEAAETMGAGGTAYGAALNAGTNAAAGVANETLGNIGAPEGQMLKGGDAGGVLAGLAGWIPQTLLNQQGGAFAEAAAQLPKSAAIESQYMMKDIIDRALEEEDDFSVEITKLLQGLPGARAELKSASSKSYLDRQEFKLKQLEANREWYLDQAKLAFLAGDKKRQQAYLKLAQQENQREVWETQGRDATGAVAPGFHMEGGRIIPDGYRMKNGIPTKTYAPGGGSSGTKPAVKAIQKIDEAGDNIASDIEGILSPDSDAPFDPRKPPEQNRPPYQKLFNRLFTSYKHLTKGNPKATAYLKQLIRAKLIAAGIKPNAGGGGAAPAGPGGPH